ncbi:GRAM domain [Trinorchestia longiramus]|nr:GRAM domain [Trinorchestia longiramus]
MKRWRLGKRRISLSKSMSNVNQDQSNSLDEITSKLRNAASISEGLWDGSPEGEDIPPQQDDASFTSTDLITMGDEDIIAIDKTVKQLRGGRRKNSSLAFDAEDQTQGQYEPVYTANIKYRSLTTKRMEASTDNCLHYDAYNPRPSSLNLEQKIITVKVTPERLITGPDLDGNSLAAPEPPKRRTSADVRRSQFAWSNTKESSTSNSREAVPRLPTIVIKDVDLQDKQETDSLEQSTASSISRHEYEDTQESLSAPPTPTSITVQEFKMEVSSSLEEEDLAGVEHVPILFTDALLSKKVRWKKSVVTERMNKMMEQHYSCALLSDILLHGTLFITKNYVAFYSKIFYHVSRVLIPNSQIKRVAKVRTAKIIPNGIGIYLHDGRRFLFGSLLSRDATYNLLVKVATDAGGLVICDSEVKEPQNNGEEETASTSGQSQTDQDGPSAHSSGSNSSTPSTDRIPLRQSLVHQSSSTSLERVDEQEAAPMTAALQKSDQVDGRVVPAEHKSDSINLYRADENSSSSSEDCASAPTSSQASLVAKNSSDRIQAGIYHKKETRSPSPEQNQKKASLVRGILRTTFFVMRTPRSSVFNIMFCCVLMLLLASSAILMYKIQKLSDDLSAVPMRSHLNENNILELQQRLHSSAASELEKVVGIQLQQLSMVRRSLNDLLGLFHPEKLEGDESVIWSTAATDVST